MNCSKCGLTLKTRMKFCPRCGMSTLQSNIPQPVVSQPMVAQPVAPQMVQPIVTQPIAPQMEQPTVTQPVQPIAAQTMQPIVEQPIAKEEVESTVSQSAPQLQTQQPQPQPMMQPIYREPLIQEKIVTENTPVPKRKFVAMLEMGIIFLLVMFQGWISCSLIGYVNMLIDTGIDDSYNIFTITALLAFASGEISDYEGSSTVYLLTFSFIIVCILIIIGLVLYIKGMVKAISGGNEGEVEINWKNGFYCIIWAIGIFYATTFLFNAAMKAEFEDEMISSICQTTWIPLLLLVISFICINIAKGYSYSVLLERSKQLATEQSDDLCIVYDKEKYWKCSKCNTLNYYYVGSCKCGAENPNRR